MELFYLSSEKINFSKKTFKLNIFQMIHINTYLPEASAMCSIGAWKRGDFINVTQIQTCGGYGVLRLAGIQSSCEQFKNQSKKSCFFLISISIRSSTSPAKKPVVNEEDKKGKGQRCSQLRKKLWKVAFFLFGCFTGHPSLSFFLWFTSSY